MNFSKSKPSTAFYIMLVSFALFVLIAFGVKNIPAVHAADLDIDRYLHIYSSAHPINIAKFITDLGDFYGLAYMMLYALVTFAWFNRYKEVVLVIIATQSAYIASVVLKGVFSIPRPPVELHLLPPFGYSFPSGHAFMSMVFYGFLVYFCFEYITKPWIRFLLSAALILLILSIGFSRIYLGVHYPTDVLGGFCLGIFWISLWVMIDKKFEGKTR